MNNSHTDNHNSPLDKLTHLFPDLVTNINHTYPKLHTPKPISIVLDGGGFSGSHIIGALAYLQFLVHDKRITIDRISGVSVGSICAILFRLGRLDIAFKLYTSTREHFEKHADLSIISNHLEYIHNIMPNKFYKTCRIWISYFDIEKQQHITVNKFISNEHIISVIRRSIHVPWLFDRSIALHDRFIDGLYPHTFTLDPPSSPIIFLNLLNMPWTTMFRVSNKETILDCATNGAMQIHTFLASGENNPFCHTFIPISYRGAIFVTRVIVTQLLVRLIILIKGSEKYPFIEQWAQRILGQRWKQRARTIAEKCLRRNI